MRLVKLAFVILSVLLLLTISSSSGNLNSGISEELKGQFLIRTANEEEAWYADPTTGKLHYLGRSDDAFVLMQQLGLPISNANLNKLKGEGSHSSQVDTILAQQLAGRIILQVEEGNEAWYVWPNDQQRYFIGRPEDAQRVFDELGVEITEEEFASLQKSDSYYQSINTFNLAVAAIEDERAGTKTKSVQSALQDGLLERKQVGYVVLISFELSSPLSTEFYGYLGRGLYYWRPDGSLMSRDAYLTSEEYQLIDAKDDAQAIIDEMLALRTALNFYFTDVNGYPLSQNDGDEIGDQGRRFLTNPKGFFGSLRDPIVYHELSLPSDILDLTYYSSGTSYGLVFTIPASIEFYSAGTYTLTPDGVEQGKKLAHLEPAICPAVFTPVCGADGKTYSNTCYAEREEMQIIAEGPCPAL